MADEDPELEVRITTEADTSGTDAAAAGIDKVKGASGEAAHTMRELLINSRHTHEVFRGIEAASRGGAGGIIEMARGLRGLLVLTTEAIGASGLGGLLIVLGLVGGALLSMRKSTDSAKEGLKETTTRSEELKKSLEATAKSVEASFKGMAAAAKELVTQMEALDKIQKASEAASARLESAKAGLAGAKLDLEEQNSLAAASPDDQEHIKDVFAQRRKIAALDSEAAKSGNDVLSAEAEAGRNESFAARARGLDSTASSAVAAANAKSAEATRRATTFGSKLLSGGSISEADERTRQKLADEAFTAQGVAKTAQSEYDKVHGELGKATTQSEASNSKLQEARDIDKANQEKIAVEKQVLIQIEAGKANQEAAKQLKEAADALKEAAKSRGKGEENHERGDTKADKVSEAASENNRTIAGEKAAERMSEGAGKVKSALEKHTAKTAEVHEGIVSHLTKATGHIERTTRQLVNAGSYDASP